MQREGPAVDAVELAEVVARGLQRLEQLAGLRREGTALGLGPQQLAFDEGEAPRIAAWRLTIGATAGMNGMRCIVQRAFSDALGALIPASMPAFLITRPHLAVSSSLELGELLRRGGEGLAAAGVEEGLRGRRLQAGVQQLVQALATTGAGVFAGT